ncbi:hypothetical protein OAV88_03790 [bacterium]|nr:hypothetical protein [bacterium]
MQYGVGRDVAVCEGVISLSLSLSLSQNPQHLSYNVNRRNESIGRLVGHIIYHTSSFLPQTIQQQKTNKQKLLSLSLSLSKPPTSPKIFPITT